MALREITKALSLPSLVIANTPTPKGVSTKKSIPEAYTIPAITLRSIIGIPVEGVTLDKDSISFYSGDTQTLTPTITPSSATNKTVTWSSSDETIATVNDGVVTGVGVGTVTITVTTNDGGFTDTCSVEVLAPPERDSIIITNCRSVILSNISITITSDAVAIMVDNSKVHIKDSTISNRAVAITSSNLSKVISDDNTGTGNTTVLFAEKGGFIYKVGTTQPTGTTAEDTETGGHIF